MLCSFSATYSRVKVNINSNILYKFQCILSRRSPLRSISTYYQFSTKPYYNPFGDYQHQHTIKRSSKKRKRILVCGDGDLSYGASLAIGLNKIQGADLSVNEMSMNEDGNVELIVSVLECEMVHNQGTLVKSKIIFHMHIGTLY